MLAAVGEQRKPGSVDVWISAEEREEVLLKAMLRHQVGIDPYAVVAVLDLVAVGMVNSAWRNSPVEDWHADGRLDDGEMLRISAYSTWRIRQIIRRWRAEVGRAAPSHIDALDAIEVDQTDRLAVGIYRWLANPNRRLPTGLTLAELAGDSLDEYREHADRTLGGFAAMAQRQEPATRCGDRPLMVVWPAVTGGVRQRGRHWWTGSFTPWTIPTTRTGEQIPISGGDCEPSLRT